MERRSARDIGFDPERLDAAFRIVATAAGTKPIPAAALAVGRGNAAVEPRAWGFAVFPEDQREPVRDDTLFDLASLTKVLATATACWWLVERGKLRLQERVREILPDFGAVPEGEDPEWRQAVSVWHLLAHTSGLPAGRDLRRVEGGRAERLAAVAKTPLAAPPGSDATYSDLGFMLLAAIVETVAGYDLPAFCAREIFGPLGMRETGWNPAPALARRAAATEWVSSEHAPNGKEGFLRGVVHDENARTLGGVAGHAGLFSTVPDLMAFAAMLSGYGSVLSPHTIARMATPVVVRDVESRTLGWQGPGKVTGPFGDLWTAHSFGHTGFTGTSLWVDRGHDLWIILLTNAVHMGRDLGRPALQSIRANFHNAVIGALT